MKNVFKKSIASSLIGLIGINTLTWIPSAWAEAPRVSSPSYTLSFDIPDHGVIDLYHSSYMVRDRISNSLYLLRNTAVEDLLNTRRSLKTLIGGTRHLQQIAGSGNASFAVPGGIVDLYLLGRLGADAASASDSATLATLAPNASNASAHAIDVETVPEIANAIHWIAGNEPSYDENLRARLLLGLAYVSAQLTQFDQQLKFVQNDYWVDPGVSEEFYKNEVEPVQRAESRSAAARGVEMIGVSSSTLELIKSMWLDRHHMKDVINVLAGHREYLLDRYHLLGIEVEGKPLYKHIYEAMHASGFPAADLVQPPVEHHLATGDQQIPLPSSFENSVDAAFGGLTAADTQSHFVRALSHAANDKVDNALAQSLQANTERLTALASQIDYNGDRSSPLLELARYGDLWDTALSKYSYLKGIIDIEGARAELSQYWDRRDTTNRRLRYTAYGIGIGIGVAAIVFSGGAAAEGGAAAAEGGSAATQAASLLGIPVRSWLVGAGMLTDAGLSYDVYVNSAEAALVAKGLYLGTTHVGTNSGMHDAIEMKESDFHLLLGSLIALGAGTTQLVRLASVRTVVVRAGQTFVRLTTDEMAALRGVVTKIASRAEALAPMGRALLATVRNVLGMAVGEERVMALGDAINSVARELRLAPAQLTTRLESVPGLGGMMRKWRVANLSSKILIERALLKQAAGEAVSIPSTFGRNMVNQQLNNFVVSVVSERLARGSHMLHDERNEFLGDMVRGTLLTAVLTINGSPMLAEAQAQVPGATSGLRLQGGFWQNPVGQMLRSGGSNAMVGMVINGLSDGGAQAFQYIGERNKPNSPSASDRLWRVARGTAWNGFSLGVSSTLRYKFFNWMGEYIQQKAQEGALNSTAAKILIQSAWTGNNLFGGWSYVYLGQKWHFLDAGGNPVPDDAADNASQKYSGIGIEQLGGAFFRVSGDDTAASYMFDFLRGGDQAGPAPVLQ